MDQPTVKRRHWLRFSLRTLLLAMTVLCIWLAIQVNAARRQKEAVEAIRKAGGSIVFDYQTQPRRSGKPYLIAIDASASPPGPPKLRELIGDDYFRKVVGVTLQFPENAPLFITESDLAQLAKLPDLRSVALNRVRIAANDANVKRPIQNSDLVVLGQLSRLQVLGVSDADIDGSGLAHLPQPSDIRMLVLANTRIDDTGMKVIGTMTTLEELFLNKTQVTDEGLEHLQRLVNLKSLRLGEDQGITDAGLKYLSRLTNLKDIGLKGTRVTPEGIRDLQKSLPTTQISGP